MSPTILRQLSPRLILFTAALLHAFTGLHAQEEITIGVLVQDSSAEMVIKAAQMAAEKANRQQDDRLYKLEIRSMEGPWGTGAGRAVELVFGKNVSAVVTSADGRNSHLAEQVSAKTQVPFISAWSGDPTLAQAFVPWYYCVVPNYIQQAESMSRFIASKQEKTVVLSGDDYDSQLAARSFKKAASRYNLSVILLNENETDRLKELNPQNIILFFIPERTYKIVNQVRQQNSSADIFLGLAFSGPLEPDSSDIITIEGTYFICPGYQFTDKGQEFRKEFMKKFKKSPGNAAAYVYDAVTLVTEATKITTDRTLLKQVLSSAKFEGITGLISFDKNGNRNEIPGLMRAEKGRFVKLE